MLCALITFSSCENLCCSQGQLHTSISVSWFPIVTCDISCFDLWFIIVLMVHVAVCKTSHMDCRLFQVVLEVRLYASASRYISVCKSGGVTPCILNLPLDVDQTSVSRFSCFVADDRTPSIYGPLRPRS